MVRVGGGEVASLQLADGCLAMPSRGGEKE